MRCSLVHLYLCVCVLFPWFGFKLVLSHTPGASCSSTNSCSQVTGRIFSIIGIHTDPDDGDAIDYIFAQTNGNQTNVYDPTITVLAGDIVTFSLTGFDQDYPFHLSLSSQDSSLSSPVMTVYASSSCIQLNTSFSWYPSTLTSTCNLTWYIPINQYNQTKAYYRATTEPQDLTGIIYINSSSLNTSVTTAPPASTTTRVPIPSSSSSSSSSSSRIGNNTTNTNTNTAATTHPNIINNINIIIMIITIGLANWATTYTQ